jgi:hypothetical protein
VGAFWVGVVLGRIELPFDQEYGAVLYLMWNGVGAWLPALIRLGIEAACVLVPFALIVRVLWSHDIVPAFCDRLWNWCYRYALVLPVGYLVATSFSRYVANAVYLGASVLPWDLTPYLAMLELPFLEVLQRSADSPQARALYSWLYSLGWYVPMATLVPILAVRDKAVVVNRLLTAQLLTAIAAVPLFVAFPVFEPWTLNVLYGGSGSSDTHVRFLHSDADVAALSRIVSDLRWATGACLPSLHFAFPFVSGLLLWRSRLRLLGAGFLLLGALTAYTIVFLGRHWVVDVLVAIPYAFGIAWAAERLNVRFTLPMTQDHAGPVLLPREAEGGANRSVASSSEGRPPATGS